MSQFKIIPSIILAVINEVPARVGVAPEGYEDYQHQHAHPGD